MAPARDKRLDLVKQALVLDYLHTTGTAHSVKELETALPPIVHVSAYQVKDYLEALVDEGSVYMKKIGSGHWYWSFFEGVKKDRVHLLSFSRVERHEAFFGLVRLREQIQQVSGAEARHQPGGYRDEMDLRRKQRSLVSEIAVLRAELQRHHRPTPDEKFHVEQATVTSRVWEEHWANNVFLLEQRVLAGLIMTGHGIWAMEAFRQQMYGADYREIRDLTPGC